MQLNGPTPMQVNLNQLRAFYLTVRNNSITKAAEALFVTQPAVTMQIKSLEEHLNTRLFRKKGKALELTHAGNILYGYAVRIFDIVDEMENVLPRYSDLTEGSLTIGTTRSFARHLLPGILSHFQERFPKVKVYLKEGSSQEIAHGLKKFRYDLGIIGRIPISDRLKVVPHTKEEFCLVTAVGHRFAEKEEVSINEIRNEPVIIRESGSGSRHAILSLLNSFNVKPSVIVEAGSVEFIKEYIIKGRGISFLYKPEVEREVEMGLMHCFSIKEGPILIQTDIVYPRDLDLSPSARAFLGLMKTESK